MNFQALSAKSSSMGTASFSQLLMGVSPSSGQCRSYLCRDDVNRSSLLAILLLLLLLALLAFALASPAAALPLPLVSLVSLVSLVFLVLDV